MHRRNIRLLALFCIELILMLPFYVSAFTMSSPIIEKNNGVVTVIWSSEVETNLTIYYSKLGDSGSSSILSDPAFSVNHSTPIYNLDPGAGYSYEVHAFSRENTVETRVGRFIVPDMDPPPQPSGLNVVNATEDRVEIEWNTLSGVDDFSHYVIFRNGIIIANASRTRHIDTDNITALTTYLYQVAAEDKTGNIGAMSDSVFANTPAPDLTPPNLQNVRAVGVSNDSAFILWDTDEAGNSIVYYGTGQLDQIAEIKGSHTQHSVTLNRLEYNRNYRFVASSCDSKGNCMNASEDYFIPGGDYTAPTLEVNIPEIHNANKLNINGTTEPLTMILVYMNGQDFPNKAIYANTFGDFKTELYLDVSKGTNTIKLEAIDKNQNKETKEYTIRVDAEKPVVAVAEIPSLITKSSLSINGTVSEDVNLDVYVINENQESLPAPSEVEDFSSPSTTSSAIHLRWKANDRSEEVIYYMIYRDDMFIGTSDTTAFTDCINSDTTYKYEITAVNKQCTIGPKSDSLVAGSTPGNGCSNTENLIGHNCSEVIPVKTVSLKQGSFKQSIALQPGKNAITLKFTDDADNMLNIYSNVIYDIKAPNILWDNIDDLDPTYDGEVTIKGQVDENATVIITVNNDSTFVGLTDKDGNFSIEIELEKIDFEKELEEERSSNQYTGRAVSDITGNLVDESDGEVKYTTSDGYEVGTYDSENYYSYQEGNEDLMTTSVTVNTRSGQWKNLISIVAVDNVGRRSEPPREGWITYAMCSMGNYWGITLHDLRPGILIPRLLLNGIAQITFSYSLEWLGGSTSFEDEEIPKVSSRVSFRKINREERDNWDTSWFTVKPVICKPNTNCTEGYVVIQSKKLNPYFGDSDKYRRDLANAIKEGKEEEFETSYDMEENISKHRQDECVIKNFGCVKLPLELELRFSDPLYKTGSSRDSNLLGAYSGSRSSTITQRQCWDLETGIDKRIDPGIIPKSFLEKAINVLNKTITVIDQVLKPLNKLKEYVLYTCLGSWILLYVKSLSKRWNCEWSGRIKSLWGKGFKISVAQQGLCKLVYGGDEGENEEQYEACQVCTDSIKEYDDFTETMQYICDRIACPSAPSFTKYVRDAQRSRGTKSSAVIQDVQVEGETKHFQLELTQKSDCAELNPLNLKEIENQYARWKGIKNNGKDDFTFPNPKESYEEMGYNPANVEEITCYDPHVPNTDCCVIEYMRKYDSVCGLTNGLLFDEMKESYCVAGKRGSTEENEGGRGFSTTTDVDYETECLGFTKTLWNAFAGICEKGADENMKLIDAHVQYASTATDYFSMPVSTPGTAPAEEKSVGVKDVTDEVNKYENLKTTADTGSALYFDGGCPTTLRPHDNHNVFYRVIPITDNMEKASGSYYRENEEDIEYAVHRGVILKNIDLIQPVVGHAIDIDDVSPVGASMVFQPLARLPANWFQTGSEDTISTKKDLANTIPNQEGFYEFKKDMAKCASDVSQKQTEENLQKQLKSFLVTRNGKNRDEIISEYEQSDEPDIRQLRGSVPAESFSQILNENQGLFDDNNNLKDISNKGIIDPSGAEMRGLEGSIITTYGQNKVISDTYATSVYNQIRDAMEITEKDEIVDPTSSFLRSIQCICLPAITGYLKLWRAIMTAVKACLQTILMTGDGNPGICQAILSMYVCDLIYDLIRCFSTKFNTGFNRNYDAENVPGNILGALTSAGRDVERTVASRYGNANFFRALFAERQLMHAVCLWFFTGTFQFDFDALIEGEYGDVPVDSQALLAPCQRRFISYNTASNGRVTWNYYAGVGLVAGAPLTYRLYLQCSEGYNCDYGFGPEMCDCSEEGEKKRFIGIRGATSNLQRFDVLEETIDEVIEDDVRYDKLVIEYTYLDKDRDRVTNDASCKIKTVGGDPPGFCQFDVGLGIYRCGINQSGMESYAVLSQIIDPKTQGWLLNEILTINAVVNQKVPETLECNSIQSCEATKYLAIELKDEKNNLLIDPELQGNYRPILIDGTMTYSLPVTDFVLREGLVTGNVNIDNTGNKAATVHPDDMDGFVEPSSVEGQLNEVTDKIVLELKNNLVKVKESTIQGELTGDNDGKCEFRQYKLEEPETHDCYYKLDNREINFSIRTMNNSGRVTLISRYEKDRIAPDTAGQPSDLCNGKNEAILRGRVIIYDSTGSAGIYQKSNKIYEYQGSPQEKAFSIRLICKKDGTSTTTTSGIQTFTDIVRFVKLNGVALQPNGINKITYSNKFTISMETYDNVNSVTYVISPPGGNQESLASKEGYLRAWESRANNEWKPASAGDYTLQIAIRPMFSDGTKTEDYEIQLE